MKQVQSYSNLNLLYIMAKIFKGYFLHYLINLKLEISVPQLPHNLPHL